MIQPSVVDIELTNICNQKCAFCLRPAMQRPAGMMDIQVFKGLIDELAEFDFPDWGKIVFAGFGEPTLHPHFIEAVEYAGSKNLPLRIYTNGTRLNDKIRQALIHPGIETLKLSINVHGAEMLTRVMGSGILWGKLIKDVHVLLRDRVVNDIGPEITIQLLYTANLPVQIKNREIAALDNPQMALAAIKFWQTQSLKIAAETGVSSMVTDIKEADIGLGQEYNLFESIKIKLCPYLPYRTHFDASRDFPSGLNFAGCTRHFKNIVIFWDGSCTPCCTDVSCQMYLGNITESSIRQVFNAAVAVRNRRNWLAGCLPELCQICLDEVSSK